MGDSGQPVRMVLAYRSLRDSLAVARGRELSVHPEARRGWSWASLPSGTPVRRFAGLFQRRIGLGPSLKRLAILRCVWHSARL